MASAVRVRELLTPMARSQRGDLVLDLSGLRYLDGQGLDALIGLASWIRGTLVLRDPSGLPRLLLDRSRIADLVPHLRIEHTTGPRWGLAAGFEPGDGIAG